MAIPERSGLCVSQVADEILYTGLIEMQELWGVGGSSLAPPINTESSFRLISA